MRLFTKICTAAAAIASAFAGAQTYRMVDLSVGSPFDQTLAYGISDSGLITGTGYFNSTGDLDAFIYQNGAIQDLGMFGYPYGADGDAINDAGQIAATGYGPGYNALLYSNGVAKPIGNIDGGYSVGLSINNHGDIVGRAQNGDGGNQGFTYINGQFSAMSTDIARGINDLDQVVGSMGYYWSYGGYVHGVEHGYVDNSGTLTDIGNLGGGLRTNTEAYAINNVGQITGYSTCADGTIHAFLYNGGGMLDLGTFAPYYTYGVSINDSAQVAGNIETYGGGQVGVFLYSNGVLSNLADLCDSSINGWTGLSMSHMNSHGVIVGNGTHNGSGDAFMAVPYFIDTPTSYSIYRGLYVSGTLASLFTIDNDDLVVRNGITLNPNEPPASVVVQSTSTVAAPTDLRLSLTAHTSTVGLTQTVELWDYQAGAWVVAGTQAGTRTDSTEVAVGSNPGRFIQSGTGAIQARVSWKQTGITLTSRWTASIDQIVWNISP